MPKATKLPVCSPAGRNNAVHDDETSKKKFVLQAHHPMQAACPLAQVVSMLASLPQQQHNIVSCACHQLC